MKVDLHCHSYYSDGDCSPSALVEMAIQNQVTHLSITDHDNIEVYQHLPSIPNQLQIIPGIECSVTWQRQEFHVVGLNIDLDSISLKRYLHAQLQRRYERALKISAELKKLGIHHSFEKVAEVAGHSVISRTHFAKFLIKEDIVRDHQTAFRKYLGSRAPAYIPSQWASLEETVAVIRQAGGQAVLAHPMHYGLSTAKTKALFKCFREAGGVAAEVVSGATQTKEILRWVQMSSNFRLKMSSGSDFHRPSSHRVGIGQQSNLPAHASPLWMDWAR